MECSSDAASTGMVMIIRSDLVNGPVGGLLIVDIKSFQRQRHSMMGIALERPDYEQADYDGQAGI